MYEVWAKCYRPTTGSVLWLKLPEELAGRCSEIDSLNPALDFIGMQTAWLFIPQKFFIINSEIHLESLMENEQYEK